MSKEAMAYAFREAGKAVAAFALSDEAIRLDSKDPAIKSRANEIEATISLAGPYAQLKHDPATDIEQAQQGEWAADELRAYSRVADAVLCRSRPGEPPPEATGGAVILEPEEAIEALSTLERLKEDAKTFVADRWFAISSVAAALLERQSISGDEIEAIVRSHSAGQAS